MDGLEIPPFFICPISLQIMKDPVTLSTGMTYDRESIDQWLVKYNHKTCPVTKQTLSDQNLTPNTTLLRLIQSWCAQNSSEIATAAAVNSPKPTFDVSLFDQLLNEIKSSKNQISHLKALRKIRSLVQENNQNRRYAEETGVSILIANVISFSEEAISHLGEGIETIEEAINVLHALKPSPEALKILAEERNGRIIVCLSLVMQRGSYRGRIQAALHLKSMFKVVDERQKTNLKAELFDGVVEILKDQNSSQAAKAALLILVEVIPFGMNVTKAVEAGVVAVLVELLAETNERRTCELMLRVLEVICGKADGRAAMAAHPASVAAVASKILRMSQAANERALKLLLQLNRFCYNSGVLREMLEVGGVAKVCLVMQAQCSAKAKKMAKEILGLHAKAWNKSPCFPPNMIL